jgi:hypothetical protein
MERVNVSIQKQIERGHQIIAKAGGVHAYDEKARRQRAPQASQEVRQ